MLVQARSVSTWKAYSCITVNKCEGLEVDIEPETYSWRQDITRQSKASKDLGISVAFNDRTSSLLPFHLLRINQQMGKANELTSSSSEPLARYEAVCQAH